MMKVTLKMSWPRGSPSISGRRARSSETAPRSPTQATKAVSSRWKRTGQRQSHTATGRATKMRKAASAIPCNSNLREFRRRGEEAEDDEHGDLRKPGHAVLEAAQRQRLAQPAVPGDQPRHVDGEETAAMDRSRHAEKDQRGGEHDDRVEPRFQVEPIDDPHDGVASGQPEQEPEPPISRRKAIAKVRVRPDSGAPAAMSSSSVTVRKIAIGSLQPELDLEHRADAVAQMDAPDAQQEEHRGRVGRADDGAEQEGVQPVGPEHEPRRGAHEQGRHARRRSSPAPSPGAPPGGRRTALCRNPESNRMMASATLPRK